MTRINLINPRELTDQHLVAEYRELPRIFWIVKKKLLENKEIKVWKEYKMWRGHVIFFYDKLGFLEKRYYEIVKECKKRWFNISFSELDLSDIPKNYKKDFFPTKQDINISFSRIKDKLDNKKWFYKMYWKEVKS